MVRGTLPTNPLNIHSLLNRAPPPLRWVPLPVPLLLKRVHLDGINYEKSTLIYVLPRPLRVQLRDGMTTRHTVPHVLHLLEIVCQEQQIL